MLSYDPASPLNLSLLAIAETAKPGSLGEALLASCEDIELDCGLLAAAVMRQLSAATTSLAGFNYHGGENLDDATELVERAEDFFTLAAVFVGQAELRKTRIEDLHKRRNAGNLIDFPRGE